MSMSQKFNGSNCFEQPTFLAIKIDWQGLVLPASIMLTFMLHAIIAFIVIPRVAPMRAICNTPVVHDSLGVTKIDPLILIRCLSQISGDGRGRIQPQDIFCAFRDRVIDIKSIDWIHFHLD